MNKGERDGSPQAGITGFAQSKAKDASKAKNAKDARDVKDAKRQSRQDASKQPNTRSGLECERNSPQMLSTACRLLT